MFRIPLWPVTPSDSRLLGSFKAEKIPLLDLHEITAGKLCALLSREAARDLFDAHQLLTQKTLEKDRLRLAFIVYGAMNRKDWLEKSLKPLPPAVTLWGSIFAKIMAMFVPLIHVPATNVDLVLGDEDLSLADCGVPGRIITTPGHSMGSVSVLLETGDAFVGDLAMKGLPMRIGPGLPIFAEDLQKVKRSWQLLLDKGATTVYPAHGKPFSAEGHLSSPSPKWKRFWRMSGI